MDATLKQARITLRKARDQIVKDAGSVECGNDSATSQLLDGIDLLLARKSAAPELLAALEDLQKELRAHVKFDVRKHYSLMVADVAASKAINKARA